MTAAPGVVNLTRPDEWTDEELEYGMRLTALRAPIRVLSLDEPRLIELCGSWQRAMRLLRSCSRLHAQLESLRQQSPVPPPVCPPAPTASSTASRGVAVPARPATSLRTPHWLVAALVVATVIAIIQF